MTRTAPMPEHPPHHRFTDANLLTAWGQYKDEDTQSVRLSNAAHWFCQEHRMPSDCADAVASLIRQAVEES